MWDTLYRPLKFAEVLGQEGNVRLLKARLKNGTAFDTSYIFAGSHGRGKTTLARIHARAMLCLNLDKSDPEPCNECENCTMILKEQPGAFVERDAASHGTVEHARAIVEDLPYILLNAPKRIYLFDESQRMSIAAQDVLLKPIEDKKMVAMFCTTEVEKIRSAIRSRCEEYTIRKVVREEILKRTHVILEKEAVAYEDDAIYIVIDHSGGHVRDVINKLEMISQLGPVTLDNVRSYLHLSVITLYYKILLSLGDPVQAIELVDQACEQVTPEEVAVGIAEAAMNTYRVAQGIYADFSFIDKGLAEKVYNKYQSDVIRFAQWFLEAKYTTKLSLVRDIVIFSQTSGHLPFTTSASSPVVFANLPQPVSMSTVRPEPMARPETSIKSEAALEAKFDADYADPTIPTDIEAHVVNAPLPRGRNSDAAELPRKSRQKKSMTPADWRRIFEQFLRQKITWLP